jgi:hypothetical protein
MREIQNDWNLTKPELHIVIDEVQDMFIKEFSNVSSKDVKKVFRESLLRYIVQDEIRTMMEYLLEDD